VKGRKIQGNGREGGEEKVCNEGRHGQKVKRRKNSSMERKNNAKMN
jgi:hypothetical protein